VILVTCSYREREFVRVGYYVNNEYSEEYSEETGPPMPLDMNKVVRTILADKPRVTRFQINWGDLSQEKEEQDESRQQQQQDIMMSSNSHVGFGSPIPQDAPATDTTMIPTE